LPTAKLVQKLRCRKGTKSSFCAKVFIGFENLVMAQTFLIQKYISFFSETFSILLEATFLFFIFK